MSLWSLLAAPLLAGNDLRDMPPAILAILTNREVIAHRSGQARQAGQASHAIGRPGNLGARAGWRRQAVGLFNRSADAATISIAWSDLGLNRKPRVRNLWTHQDVAVDGPEYSATVPAHGVVLLRVTE